MADLKGRHNCGEKVNLQDEVTQRLSRVIDPETGLSIVRMGMVRDIRVDKKTGDAYVLFRPTSFFCPMAFKLAVDIRDAIRDVPGVNGARVEVEDFARARELNQLLAEE